MSETIPSGKPDQASGNEPEKKDQVAYESYQKLLAEKKRLQSEHLEAKTKLEEYEQAKLEAEGKLKEALENAKQLNAKLKTEKVEIYKKVADKTVRSQFFRKAEKLGCNDPELAMKALKFDDLEITEDFEFDEKKLDEKLQALTKEKPFLFKKEVKLPDDITPNNKPAQQKPLSDMSTEELLKQYKAISLKG
jgi:hypothetical protein